MRFDPSLQPAILLKRYKRFLADVATPGGRELMPHCLNTGAMTGCVAPGDTVWYSTSDNVKHRYAHTWELAETQQGAVICISTLRANSLAKEAISAEITPELSGYNQLKSEVKYGEENNRVDIMLQTDGRQNCYIEMKSVTLVEKEYSYFPDTVITRGRKHLREPITVATNGNCAVILSAALHSATDRSSPAHHVNVRYARLLTKARDKGVEILTWKAELSTTKMILNRPIAVVLNPRK